VTPRFSLFWDPAHSPETRNLLAPGLTKTQFETRHSMAANQELTAHKTSWDFFLFLTKTMFSARLARIAPSTVSTPTYIVPVGIWTDHRGRVPHQAVHPWRLIPLGNASLLGFWRGSPLALSQDGRNLFLATMRKTGTLPTNPQWIALRSGRRAQGTGHRRMLRTCSSVADVAEQATAVSKKNRSIVPCDVRRVLWSACLRRFTPY
jgi:hypothetical protein